MAPRRAMLGLRHLALKVRDMRASRRFYEEILGLRPVWIPDPLNVYLSSGGDNLALHEAPAGEAVRLADDGAQRLDHLGFLLEAAAEVDAWAARLRAAGVPFVKEVKTHRDGSRSFYVRDPDGNVVQILYEPNVAGGPPAA